MIELDKRIISGKKPLTCFDAEQARNFVTKNCYLTNDISLFSDLNAFKNVEWGNSPVYEGVVDTLTNINTEVTLIFETSYRRWKFCIPCEWVKEKKKAKKNYRPFTISEFIQKYSVGELFKIREKQNRFTVSELQYVGHKVYEPRIYLGITDFTLDELFENFEMCINNDCWIPFGTRE